MLLVLLFCVFSVSKAVAHTSSPYSNSTSAISPSATRNESITCPLSCYFDGPLITGYAWARIVANATTTITVEVLMPTGFDGNPTSKTPGLSPIQTRKSYSSRPGYSRLPAVDRAGTVLGTAAVRGTDGSTSALVLEYPTAALDYASTYGVRGALHGHSNGTVCPTTTSTVIRTLPQHPPYSIIAPFDFDLGGGSNFALVPITYLDLTFLRSSFPNETAFELCASPTVPHHVSATTGTVFVTVTVTKGQTTQSVVQPSHTKDTLTTIDDDGFGFFSVFLVHVETTVPISDIDDGSGHGSTAARAHTEVTAAASRSTEGAGSTSPSGLEGGKESNLDPDDPSDDSTPIADIIASIIGASPGGRPSDGAPTPTPSPKSFTTTDSFAQGSDSGGFGQASGNGSPRPPDGINKPAQSITVGTLTLPVVQTIKPFSSVHDGILLFTDMPMVLIGSSTATLGQTLTFDGTPVVFTDEPSSEHGAGVTGAQGSVKKLIIGGSRTIQLSLAAKAAADGRIPAITIGDQLIKPTSLDSGGFAYVVGSETLRPGYPISLRVGGQTMTVSLAIDAQGNRLLVQGTTTATLKLNPGQITVGNEVIRPTALSNAIGYVVSGQTLYPGHPITIGTGTQTTVLRLTTDAAGNTALVEGTKTFVINPTTGTDGGSAGDIGADNENTKDKKGGVDGWMALRRRTFEWSVLWSVIVTIATVFVLGLS